MAEGVKVRQHGIEKRWTNRAKHAALRFVTSALK